MRTTAIYGEGAQKSVLCREVVPFSEGPLPDIPPHQFDRGTGKLHDKEYSRFPLRLNIPFPVHRNLWFVRAIGVH